MTDRADAPPPPTSRTALIREVEQGYCPQYLVFPDWGGAPPMGWLSPWIPTPFEDQGRVFFSGEHRMMYGKALLFGDPSTADRILRARLPMQARELGRQVRGFALEIWEQRREGILLEANRAKFSALPELRSYLISTWPHVLVQASPLDCVWGSGLDLADPMLRHPVRWPGLNLVGFSLMQVRSELDAPVSL